MNARQHDRRLAGIERRDHPGVDAEIRRQHHALPVERGGDALVTLAAGGEERGDAGDQHQTPDRIRVTPGDARRRQAGLERARRLPGTLDMGIPQRERIRILTADRQGIGDRGRRPVGQTAVPVEPAKRVGHAGNAQKHERDRGRDNQGRRTPPARPRGPMAAATAKRRARRPRGTARSRSQMLPGAATAAPRKSSTAHASAQQPAGSRCQPRCHEAQAPDRAKSLRSTQVSAIRSPQCGECVRQNVAG